jgi:hypothetical protein
MIIGGRVMDIKEIVKEMTREEFEEELKTSNYGWKDLKGTREDTTCPSDIKLIDFDNSRCSTKACKQCWLNSIKDVKFKGEIFNWEDFKNGKIAICCDTEEKLKDFLRECEKQNLKWPFGVGNAIKFNPWDVYKGKTVIGHNYKNSNFLSYSSKGFYEGIEGLKIIDWELINVKEFAKSDLKDGMVAIARNNIKYLVLGNAMHRKDGWSRLSEYENDLKHKAIAGLDIMAVYEDKNADKYYAINSVYGDTSMKSLALIWERKERKPADFMTAIKAYNQGKKISCEVDKREFLYSPTLDKGPSRIGYLVKCNTGSISTKEILEGTWYIED